MCYARKMLCGLAPIALHIQYKELEKTTNIGKKLESAVKLRKGGKSREQTVNILCYSVCIGNGSGG